MLAEEESAIGVVFEEHYPRLERHLTRILRDPDEARDLASEAFVRLSREVAMGRPPGNPPAWLHRVGANLARSRGRHLTVVGRRQGDVPRTTDPVSPESVAMLSETCRDVARLLSELSTCERAAVSLAASGYSPRDIAVTLGRTPGATRALLCRARAKLRHRMGVV